jgi:hypothetical protein
MASFRPAAMTAWTDHHLLGQGYLWLNRFFVMGLHTTTPSLFTMPVKWVTGSSSYQVFQTPQSMLHVWGDPGVRHEPSERYPCEPPVCQSVIEHIVSSASTKEPVFIVYPFSLIDKYPGREELSHIAHSARFREVGVATEDLYSMSDPHIGFYQHNDNEGVVVLVGIAKDRYMYATKPYRITDEKYVERTAEDIRKGEWFKLLDKKCLERMLEIRMRMGLWNEVLDETICDMSHKLDQSVRRKLVELAKRVPPVVPHNWERPPVDARVIEEMDDVIRMLITSIPLFVLASWFCSLGDTHLVFPEEDMAHLERCVRETGLQRLVNIRRSPGQTLRFEGSQRPPEYHTPTTELVPRATLRRTAMYRAGIFRDLISEVDGYLPQDGARSPFVTLQNQKTRKTAFQLKRPRRHPYVDPGVGF